MLRDFNPGGSTDNTRTRTKVLMRRELVRQCRAACGRVDVLDLYCGHGTMRSLAYHDADRYTGVDLIHGQDNAEYVHNNDISVHNLVDFDAHGSPLNLILLALPKLARPCYIAWTDGSVLRTRLYRKPPPFLVKLLREAQIWRKEWYEDRRSSYWAANYPWLVAELINYHAGGTLSNLKVVRSSNMTYYATGVVDAEN